MKRYTYGLLALLFSIIAVTACSESVWDNLPSPISSFVTEYFPGAQVKSYNSTDDTYYVSIDNGASLEFNVNFDWTSIDGNGATLPSVMIYDQFPTPLYTYLESIEMVNDVYKVVRNSESYTITLEDSIVNYNIDSESISTATTK